MTLLGFFLSSHYLSKGESCDKGLLAALLHLKGVQFPEALQFTPGNIIGFDRGFVSNDVLYMCVRSGLNYVATIRERLSPFTTKQPRLNQRIICESGLRVSEWAVRKIDGLEHFYYASREETANKICTMMTNVRRLGPTMVCIKPRGQSQNAIFGNHVISENLPISKSLHVLRAFKSRVKLLTSTQRAASWFISRRLRITSTTATNLLHIAAITAAVEDETGRELVVSLGMQPGDAPSISNAIGSLPSSI